MKFHTPVLTKEVVDNLVTDRSGVYVDGTVGGGGHALEILHRLDQKGRLIAMDCDPEAVGCAEETLAKFKGKVSIHLEDFRNLGNILEQEGTRQISGILLDLGVSSHQLDSPQRGFSYRFEGPLDMRMNPLRSKTASDVINTYSEEELTHIFFQYGEERFARRIAAGICRLRRQKQIETTLQLRKIIEATTPRRGMIKRLSRIFQAIRIEVNDELKTLESILNNCIHFLKIGGRICVISYHSLEDRMVKLTFNEYARGCICPPHLPVCVCKRKKILKIIGRGAVFPSAQEKSVNPRARSARLRVAEKIGNYRWEEKPSASSF
ncbi:MAG TPA: 16S rRNA (cytosine(1402)-N(4))-methyltransferase RsmH [Candidatus Latescibacteria bacterium]|nr:16S rRNA (cytosine(1402)-N(4))-methyltransferase RsmH [Candidatus Latescibacterota bacterium]